jgi:hypothetical protein
MHVSWPSSFNPRRARVNCRWKPSQGPSKGSPFKVFDSEFSRLERPRFGKAALGFCGWTGVRPARRAACQRPRCARPWHARQAGPYASGGPAAGPCSASLATGEDARCARQRPPRSRPQPTRTPSSTSVEPKSDGQLRSSSTRGRPGSAPTGREEALRPSADGCQATTEEVMAAPCAAEDLRSRRGRPGASPLRTSEASGVVAGGQGPKPSTAFPYR